ncbi:MAG TPA: hypothetical protein VM940_07480 [Chthoniobacterales bacterium]|jgi:hypothetical protein|nr:hypothetical protein [Chthoniobacterales bacterium]
MKTLPSLLTALVLGAVASASAAEPAKENEREQQQLVAAAKEVQAQQAAIADNQAKIDAKLAIIAEAMRQARIYASRGGK